VEGVRGGGAAEATADAQGAVHQHGGVSRAAQAPRQPLRRLVAPWRGLGRRGGGAQAETESKIWKQVIIFQLQALTQSAVNPRLTWGQLAHPYHGDAGVIPFHRDEVECPHVVRGVGAAGRGRVLHPRAGAYTRPPVSST